MGGRGWWHLSVGTRRRGRGKRQRPGVRPPGDGKQVRVALRMCVCVTEQKHNIGVNVV